MTKCDLQRVTVRLVTCALLFLLIGCEAVGLVGQVQAQAIAVKWCAGPRFTQLQDPQVQSAEWLTPAQLEERNFFGLAREPITMFWFVSVQGRWRLDGGPVMPAAQNPPPNPIFQRCIAVLDARTGQMLAVRMEP